MGFFALRLIPTGEELTFDYQFQRFGESAQKCYCGSENCRGYLGAAKQNDSAIRSDMFVPSLINTRERKVKRRGDDVDLIVSYLCGIGLVIIILYSLKEKSMMLWVVLGA